MDYSLLVNTVFNYYNNSAFNFLRSININKDYWNYIPTNNIDVSYMVKDVIDSSYKGNFIDIGCGAPVIPNIFKILGFKSFALEYNNIFKTVYDSLYSSNFNKPVDDYFIGDLLTHNFKEYDILYSYNPIKDQLTMIKGLKNIINTMKSGAVFYFKPASVDYKQLEKLGFVQINTYCLFKYIKK